MTETVHVYAGECTTTYHGDGDTSSQRGRVVVVHKPDGTVLVHDSQGYQPVEWLTRANAVHREQGEDGSFALVAVKDDERLRVESHGDGDHARHDATPAGVAVGTCPDCVGPEGTGSEGTGPENPGPESAGPNRSGTLVWARGTVTCLHCSVEYGLPGDATVVDSTCACGLPRMAVERGARFELCVDRDCEDLDAAVRERFDREWSCPDCDGDLRVVRERTLFLGCENYPDCESSFALPSRRVVGDCECGLPLVEVDDARRADGQAGNESTGGEQTGDVRDESARADSSRCLDPDCERTPEAI